jgi:rhodanese-related sulfurtransferase
MAKKFKNIFAQLQAFESHIGDLEERILLLEQKLQQQILVDRANVIRVKNGEEISDEYIYQGREYHDLTPEKAWKLYCDPDYSFILLDVSAADFAPPRRLPEAVHIPWDEFAERFFEVTNKTTPILVISEDGTHSVLACEFLVKRGYYNCANVSGGYKFWKGFRLAEVTSA